VPAVILQGNQRKRQRRNLAPEWQIHRPEEAGQDQKEGQAEDEKRNRRAPGSIGAAFVNEILSSSHWATSHSPPLLLRNGGGVSPVQFGRATPASVQNSRMDAKNTPPMTTPASMIR